MNKRDVEVKCGDKWLLKAGLHEVKKGQTFRMWEDEEIVIGENGQTEFLAISEPYYSEMFDTWIIDIDVTEYNEVN